VAFVVTTGSVVWCEFWCQQLGQFSLNVRVYQCENSILSPEIAGQDFANILSNRARILFRNVLPAMASYYGCRVRPFPLNAETPAHRVQPTTGVFGVKGLPGQVAVLVRSTTGLFGRKHKGRNYIPFVPVSALDDANKPTATWNAAAEPLAQFLGVGGSIGTGSLGSTLQAVTRRLFLGGRFNYISASIVQTPATMRTRSKINHPVDDPPFV